MGWWTIFSAKRLGWSVVHVEIQQGESGPHDTQPAPILVTKSSQWMMGAPGPHKPNLTSGHPSEECKWSQKEVRREPRETQERRHHNLRSLQTSIRLLILGHRIAISAKAVAAIDRAVTPGPERHRGFRATLGALYLEHFSRAGGKTSPLLRSPRRSASLTALGVIYEAPRIKELLLPSGEDKLPPTIYAY